MSTDGTVSDVDLAEMTNTLFEMTDILVFFLDKEFNIILINSSVLKRTGYNFDELKGKKIHDLLSSDFKVVKE
ncbi:MAG: PAS domain S-box protein, partial [Candidatus Heimdallarchaeota archaeon]|nr:PAS domain S-box protein [Candidatus Heimdallarchaeota archaeon]